MSGADSRRLGRARMFQRETVSPAMGDHCQFHPVRTRRFIGGPHSSASLAEALCDEVSATKFNYARRSDYAMMLNVFVKVTTAPFRFAVTVAVAGPTQAMRTDQLQV